MNLTEPAAAEAESEGPEERQEAAKVLMPTPKSSKRPKIVPKMTMPKPKVPKIVVVPKMTMPNAEEQPMTMPNADAKSDDVAEAEGPEDHPQDSDADAAGDCQTADDHEQNTIRPWAAALGPMQPDEPPPRTMAPKAEDNGTKSRRPMPPRCPPPKAMPMGLRTSSLPVIPPWHYEESSDTDTEDEC